MSVAGKKSYTSGGKPPYKDRLRRRRLSAEHSGPQGSDRGRSEQTASRERDGPDDASSGAKHKS